MGGRDRSGRLRRPDPRTGEVTATTPLPDLDVGSVDAEVGLVAGDGVVWVAGSDARGSHAGGILLRIDPASGRVAGWLRDLPWFFREVLAVDCGRGIPRPGGVLCDPARYLQAWDASTAPGRRVGESNTREPEPWSGCRLGCCVLVLQP
jgi:hypothetical protein